MGVNLKIHPRHQAHVSTMHVLTSGCMQFSPDNLLLGSTNTIINCDRPLPAAQPFTISTTAAK